MRRLPSRKALVLFSLGVVVFAAFLPLVSPLFTVALTPLWVVVPAVAAVIVRRTAADCTEQPVPLLAIRLSRGPPSILQFAL